MGSRGTAPVSRSLQHSPQLSGVASQARRLKDCKSLDDPGSARCYRVHKIWEKRHGHAASMASHSRRQCHGIRARRRGWGEKKTTPHKPSSRKTRAPPPPAPPPRGGGGGGAGGGRRPPSLLFC